LPDGKMSGLYKTLIRPALFSFDPERIHNFTINALSIVSRRKILCGFMGEFFSSEPMPVEAFGLKFPNPVGLGAGMDKDAVAVPAWESMGFGFVEIGAITYHPQDGNPKPRVFRIIKENAIINRMGFNNKGAEETARKVAEYKENGNWVKIPVGVNIGKSRITPLENAAEDYEKTFRILWDLFDFFVVNVSSPNTPNLRQLQDKDELAKILTVLNKANDELKNQKSSPKKPILIKIAPDLSYEAIDEVLNLSKDISGIVATNTTITRPETAESKVAKIYAMEGGLSGKPLKDKSTEIIRFIYRQTKGKLPIIGVGGIFTAEDAWEKITSGATLIQVYTGMIYEGPSVAKNIVEGLRKILEKEGIRDISDAVGIHKNL